MDEIVDSYMGLKPREIVRLASVQALFQIEQSGDTPERIVEQFLEHRLDGRGDSDKFAKLVQGVIANVPVLDQMITPYLTASWKLDRLDATLRSILRAGVFELTNSPDEPAKVLLDAYVDLAASFFGDKETAFVNAVLDKIARQTRSKEFAA